MLKNLSLLLFATLLLNSTAHAVVVTPPVGDVCSEMFNYKAEVYVCADHPVFGKELHRINGGRYSTVVVKDIDPGPGGSGPRAFFESNGWLYFFAETTATGYALWRTDGTEDGTKLIRSIFGYEAFKVVANIGNDFFIVVTEGGSLDQGDLIRTDGTYEGTQLIVADINPRTIDSTINTIQLGTTYASLGGILYFMTDGTLFRLNENNTVMTIYENLPIDTAKFLGQLNDQLFNNKIVIEFDNEVWLSDGTIAGTGPFISRQNGIGISGVRVINNRLLYVRNDFGSGAQLFSADGQEQVELYSGLGGLRYVSSAGSRLIYSVATGIRDYTYVFTGGTVGSTKYVENLFEPLNPFSYNGFIYLNEGSRITKIDPVTGIEQALGDTGVTNSRIRYVDFRGVLYTGWCGFRCRELWLLKPNGSRIKLGTAPSYPYAHEEGGRIYFADRFTDIYGFEGSGIGIWHSNGTATSTYQLEYRYDNGEPEPEPSDNIILVPILDLLMDEEEPVPD